MTALRLLAMAGIAACLATGSALADDTSATLGAGGLVLKKTDKIALVSEELYLSATSVKISYRFRNLTNEDYSTTIAFPMPDFTGGGSNDTTVVPDPTSDNFMKFHTLVDGRDSPSQLEQRAYLTAEGKPDVEITDRLKAMHLPLVPTAGATQAAIAHLTDAQRKSLADANILDPGEVSDYNGQAVDLYPLWTLRSKYWRTQTFPAGKDVVVQQTYVPVVGSQSSVSLGSPDMEASALQAYQQKFCTDESFLKAARQLYQRAGADNAKTFTAFEQYLSYVITSGGNWAGPIGDFRLVVDKEDAKTLVSFCGDGVRKIGPTQFELDLKNYTPTRDIDVLFLRTVAVQ